MSLQARYENALGKCSRALLNNPNNQDEERSLLNQALEHLLQAVDASRAYIFRNLENPKKGLCMGMMAEVCAPTIWPQFQNMANQQFPWSQLPEDMRQKLEAGHPYGGPVKVAFAATLEWLEIFRNQRNPLLSLIEFPLFVDKQWWGFVGFDDCQTAREWNKRDIQLLSTAAEMLGSTLERWQIHNEVNIQYRYQQALARCSQLLLRNPDQEDQVQNLLDEAMVPLLRVTNASRAFVAQNFHHPDPEFGYSIRLVAEVCADGVFPQIQVDRNQQVPWKTLSKEWSDTLKAGQPFGGPVEETLAGTPQLVEMFLNQRNPLYSFITFPLHFDSEWWGFIGFDDVVTPRNWNEHEILLLQTASEMVSSALQRWEGHFLLEDRIKRRTAALDKSNRLLHQEIDHRIQAENDLARRLEIEQKLTTISSRLLEPRDIEESLQATLLDLGGLVNAQRALLIFDSNQDLPFQKQLIQWQKPEKQPLPDKLPLQLREEYTWLMDRLKAGEIVIWDSPEDLAAETAESHQLFSQYSLNAIALAPMRFEDRLVAVLVYTDFHYDEVNRIQVERILQLGTNLIGSMLHRELILSSLEKRVVQRTKELALIFDLTMLGGQARSISELLEPAVRRLAEISACQAVCIHVLSPEEDAMLLTAQVGIPESALENLTNIPILPEITQVLDYTAEKAMVGSLDNLSTLSVTPFWIQEFNTFLGCQIHARQELVGFLSAYRYGNKPFRINEISLLVLLAEQLGVLIENHRLQKQSELMAVVGERQRLARELHDSITQSLYSLTFFARSGRFALEDNDTSKLDESLQDIELGATNALIEMRLLLHQLRPFALVKHSLPDAIEQRFDDVERRLGKQATCQMPEELDLGGEILAELYRIIIEGLNNCLKHAQADSVEVRLLVDQDKAKLQITDNGVGFEQDQITPGMGLEYLDDRVNRLNGSFAIESTPGAGTQIVVEIPIDKT